MGPDDLDDEELKSYEDDAQTFPARGSGRGGGADDRAPRWLRPGERVPEDLLEAELVAIDEGPRGGRRPRGGPRAPAASIILA